MAAAPNPSSRFRKAATTERNRLLRQREKVEAKLSRLRAQLMEAEDQRDRLSDRIGSLQELAGDTGSASLLRHTEDPSDEGAVLRGSKIREAAVQILLESGRVDAPIHYREWLDLLRQAGFEIDGKRPDAVFLNQIVRSPVVRATTTAGVYEIDWKAEERLGRQMDQLKAELRQAAAQNSLDTPGMEKLALELRRIERALDEASGTLNIQQAVAA